MRRRRLTAALGAVLSVVCAGCAVGPYPGTQRPAPAASTPAPAPPPPPVTDTTICVVAPTDPSGLRTVAAKREVGSGRVVIEQGGERVPFESLYPATVAGGYAAEAPWFTGNQAITHQRRRYLRFREMRRVRPEQLRLVGHHQGILLFVDPRDRTPPQALYVPAEPGCIFQAFIREDLMPKG